jgi:hypothetical protein
MPSLFERFLREPRYPKNVSPKRAGRAVATQQAAGRIAIRLRRIGWVRTAMKVTSHIPSPPASPHVPAKEAMTGIDLQAVEAKGAAKGTQEANY